jgi:hypothetical protein
LFISGSTDGSVRKISSHHQLIIGRLGQSIRSSPTHHHQMARSIDRSVHHQIIYRRISKQLDQIDPFIVKAHH